MRIWKYLTAMSPWYFKVLRIILFRMFYLMPMFTEWRSLSCTRTFLVIITSTCKYRSLETAFILKPARWSLCNVVHISAVSFRRYYRCDFRIPIVIEKTGAIEGATSLGDTRHITIEAHTKVQTVVKVLIISVLMYTLNTFCFCYQNDAI